MKSARAITLMLNGHKLFPEIFNAARRVRFRLPDDLTLPVFWKAFRAELHKLRIAIEVCSTQEIMWMVDQTFLVLIVPADADTDAAIAVLREKLQKDGVVLVGYVIQLDIELRWRRIQVSRKWLKGEKPG